MNWNMGGNNQPQQPPSFGGGNAFSNVGKDQAQPSQPTMQQPQFSGSGYAAATSQSQPGYQELGGNLDQPYAQEMRDRLASGLASLNAGSSNFLSDGSSIIPEQWFPVPDVKGRRGPGGPRHPGNPRYPYPKKPPYGRRPAPGPRPNPNPMPSPFPWPMPSPWPDPMPNPSPSPYPMPPDPRLPRPAPYPMPMPSPNPMPMPMPSPNPSPYPSPFPWPDPIPNPSPWPGDGSGTIPWFW